MTRRAACLWAALLGVACSDVTPPDRSAAYAFTIDCGVPGTCTEAADPSLQLTFRWPAAALPVRVWVEPGGDLEEAVRRAAELWQASLLYRELAIVVVADSAAADARVRMRAPEIFGGTGADGVNCQGVTFINIDTDTTTGAPVIALPFQTAVTPRLGAQENELRECTFGTALHELGHVLGLLLHSPADSDIMHRPPRLTVLSAADVATLTLLYHTPPTVGIPAGR